MNITPTATDDGFIGYEDIPYVVSAAQLLANDYDQDNEQAQLRITGVRGAQHGTASMDAEGNITFIPQRDYHGPASFQYQVSDPDGGSTWATACVTIQNVNDPPVIEDVIYGRPIYGYRWGSTWDEYDKVWGSGAAATANGQHAGFARNYLGEPGWTLIPITDQDEARQLLANPGGRVWSNTLGGWSPPQSLMNDGGVPHAPSYYRSGDLRPVSSSLDDGWAQHIFEYSPFLFATVNEHIDDPRRITGKVIAYDPDGDSGGLSFVVGTGPQHGHAWANAALENGRAPGDHFGLPAYFEQEKGAWVYSSDIRSPHFGADDFVMRVYDSSGACTEHRIHATHNRNGVDAPSAFSQPALLAADELGTSNASNTEWLWHPLASGNGSVGHASTRDATALAQLLDAARGEEAAWIGEPAAVRFEYASMSGDQASARQDREAPAFEDGHRSADADSMRGPVEPLPPLTPEHLALLHNQMINTARGASASAPLGIVLQDMPPAEALHEWIAGEQVQAAQSMPGWAA